MIPWKTAKEAKVYIQHLLDTDNTAVEDAIMVVYRNQTRNEQAVHSVMGRNGVGFCSTDASFFSKLAESRPLNWYQIQKARPRIMKYWRQLKDYVEQKEA